ncbi:hypothetical protein ACIQUQ_04645 [Streptomyces sp. NPDC101118]|uniref:hypothetical protein n=1 Tax=Streptomyces sp. NPDC101118 TaxID=3366109 RepID=UPI0038170BF8
MSQNCRTPSPMPYPHTIGRPPAAAECRNQAVTVKSPRPSRSDGEQLTTRR